MKKELRLLKKQMIIEYPTKEFMYIAEDGNKFFDEIHCLEYEKFLQERQKLSRNAIDEEYDVLLKEPEYQYEKNGNQFNKHVLYNDLPFEFKDEHITYKSFFVASSLENITDFVYYNCADDLSFNIERDCAVNDAYIFEKPQILFHKEKDGVGSLCGQFCTLYTEFPREYPSLMLYGHSPGSDDFLWNLHITPILKYKKELKDKLCEIKTGVGFKIMEDYLKRIKLL